MIVRMNNRRTLTDAPILDAAYGRTPSRRPVWFMRQAGRSLPEYREVRKDIGMLDSCFRPELLAEITMQPVRRHDVDAAILFSDIVVPLKAAGVNLDIVPGRGPVMDTPVRSEADIKALPEVTEEQLAPVAEGIGLILQELTDTQALIGFAGAPFTLASYLIEGGPSRNHERTKALMHSDPELWDHLMQKITPMVIAFLRAQIGAGVDAIQLFDSWAISPSVITAALCCRARRKSSRLSPTPAFRASTSVWAPASFSVRWLKPAQKSWASTGACHWTLLPTAFVPRFPTFTEAQTRRKTALHCRATLTRRFSLPVKMQ